MRAISCLTVLSTSVSALLLSAGLTGSAPATAESRPLDHGQVQLNTHRPDVSLRFSSPQAGEGLLDLTVSAPGVLWAERGNESSVVSAFVDDAYMTDIVINSSEPTLRRFALGRLTAGPHTLRLYYATDRSPSDAGRAALSGLQVQTIGVGDADNVAARNAPVLYGRSLAQWGGPFQNAFTDTPLVAWHETSAASVPGHSVIQYSVVWSNEDGGTDSPALMARWGRTTDIEWIYQVEVDQDGDRVPGTGVYQAPNHATLPFAGRYEGAHPLLQTCTSNNNVCDTVDGAMRFTPSTMQTGPAGAPRERLMDTNPWTYQVMAQEMLREGRLESPSDPSTPQVGDQRSYLYVAIDHDTVPPQDAGKVGLAVGVRLKGDDTLYTSHHGVASWSLNRDVPAATTVELPLGTTPGDVAEVSVTRVPLGADSGAPLTVTDIDRAFFLASDYLPEASFIEWHGERSLTPQAPTVTLWGAGS